MKIGHRKFCQREKHTMNIMARLTSLGLLLVGLISTASADSLTTQCGASIRNTTKTSTQTFTFSSQAFTNVPNATFSVTLPTDAQRCVIVTFSASANCPLGCNVRVLDGAAEMNPSGTLNQLAFGNSSEVHSFQWARRIGTAGSHTIKLQIGNGGNGNATIGPYTVSFDLSQ
jgi:hypothetical protein